MSLRGEVIHVAIGDSACEISAHLLNLQGLAGTSSSDTDHVPSPSECTIGVTHGVYRGVHVPRAVLLGRGIHQHYSTSDALEAATSPDWNEIASVTSPSLDSWSGRAEQPVAVSSHVETQKDGDAHVDPLMHRDANQFRNQAQALAFANHSRYRAPANHARSQPSLPVSGRHVDWDEMEDEPESDDEMNDQERMRREQTHWQETQYRPSQDILNDFWNVSSPTTTNSTTGVPNDSTEKPVMVETQSQQHSWRDFLMPPYSPDTRIDSSVRSNGFNPLGGTEESYVTALADAVFLETVWEGIRQRLEACDACQGVQLIESDTDVACGWSTALLRTWMDECPHSCSWVMHVQDEAETTRDESSDSHITARKRAAVRNQVQQSLLVADQTELVHVYLPLRLASMGPAPSPYAAMALVAATLEGATLPFRLGGTWGSQVTQRLALQSHYTGHYSGTNPYGSAPHVSYREFVRTLCRSSSSRNALELDTLLPWSEHGSLGGELSLVQALQKGTSLERDFRMKQPGYDGGIHRAVDAVPGEWMNSRTVGHGLMTPLSPLVGSVSSRTIPNVEDRSLHHHFALSTSVRPAAAAAAHPPVPMDSFVRPIMEGMGIHYRPEQSLCTVVNQSLHQLTSNGYGAGSYWPSLFHSSNPLTKCHPLATVPILSVLSNSTRSYTHLHSVASAAEQIVSPRFGRQGRTSTESATNRALFRREVGAGTLPEADDCIEAVHACLDLRDSYEPPNGSGMVWDTDEDF